MFVVVHRLFVCVFVCLFGPGHDHKFSTIEFSCAYVGLHQFHPVFSALWSVLNVGAFHVLMFLSLPFFAFGCGRHFFFSARGGGGWSRNDDSDDDDDDDADASALRDFARGWKLHRQAVVYFGLWLAVEAVAAAGCAAVQRRHLFVWVRGRSHTRERSCTVSVLSIVWLVARRLMHVSACIGLRLECVFARTMSAREFHSPPI